MKAVSQKERSKQVASALASVRMEGLEPDAEAAAIFQRYVDGDVTIDEMSASINELNDRDFGPVRLPRNERSQKPA